MDSSEVPNYANLPDIVLTLPNGALLNGSRHGRSMVDDHGIRVTAEELRRSGDDPSGILRAPDFEVLPVNGHLLQSESLSCILRCLEVNECIMPIAAYPHAYNHVFLEDL